MSLPVSQPRAPRIIAAGFIAVSIALVASGCWLIPKPSPTLSPSGSASASPSASASTPTLVPVTPSKAPIVKTLTCESLVDASSVAAYGSNGFTLTPPADFATKMHNEGNPLAAFADYGGILCQWGIPSSDNVDMYAYSPITDANATTQKSALLGDGASAESHADGLLYHAFPDSEDEAWYFFGPGYWIWSYKDAAKIDEVLGHLPG